MAKLFTSRVLGGGAAAVLAAILVSFVAGCFYSIVLVYPEMPKMNEVWRVFLYVGGTSAIVSGIVTVTSLLLLIGLPLYVTSIQKRKVTFRFYALSGFVTSLAFGFLLTGLHMSKQFLTAKDYYFAETCILIVGTVVTSVFWVVVRPDRLILKP